jgi:hypothetical protein
MTTKIFIQQCPSMGDEPTIHNMCLCNIWLLLAGSALKILKQQARSSTEYPHPAHHFQF